MTIQWATTVTMFTILALGAVGTHSALAQQAEFEAISVDLIPGANDATTLGPREDCVRVDPGSSFVFDVTARGIPSSAAAIGYTYMLEFPAGTVTLVEQEPLFLYTAEGSSVLNVSDKVPSSSGAHTSNVGDLGDPHTTSESGSGVLDRWTANVSDEATPGLYDIHLSTVSYVDINNAAHTPATIHAARIAVGVGCSPDDPGPTYEPTPEPETPTQSPTEPTKTPVDTSPPPGNSPGSRTSSPVGSDGIVDRSGSPAVDDGRRDDLEESDGNSLARAAIIAALAGLGIAAAVGVIFYKRSIRPGA